jgi:hypothetical protein
MMPTCPTVTQPGNDVTAPQHWPLRSTLPLGPALTAAGCARSHVRAVLWEWGISGVTDTAELIISELVANAVTASRALDGGPGSERETHV